MMVPAEQLPTLQADGAIAQSGPFRAASDDADVERHSVAVLSANHSDFDCSWSNGIRAALAISFFEFFAGAKRFEVDDAVDGQNAVEMVDFMLQEFGEIAIVPSTEFVGFPFHVLIAHSDFAIAFDLHKDREEAKAGVPNDDLLLAAFEDFRIDKRPRLLSRQFQEDDATPHSHLRRGNAPAVSRCCTPVGERVGEIVDQRSDFGSGGIANRQCDFPQPRVAELQDALDRHGYLAAAASNRFRNSSFFSAGRNDASNELRASSRRCSSVNPKVCWAIWYSRARLVPNMAGSSLLRVTITPRSK